MAKWFGKIGFAISRETTSGTGSAARGTGIWVNDIFEKSYYGDILRHSHSFSESDGLNDDIHITNEISVIADPFALDHWQMMKYIVLSGTKWKISQVTILYPRITITVGGLYNG